MASTVSKSIISLPQPLQSADLERGRKRRRSSANLPPASHSANLRGRARRRSDSPSIALTLSEKKENVSIRYGLLFLYSLSPDVLV